jgi:TPP-dependent pyruvate/acetoin dehydrogenase alpha subunit
VRRRLTAGTSDGVDDLELRYGGHAVSESTPDRIPDQVVLSQMFRLITTISQTDERFRSMLSSGQVRSTYYSPKGQECIAAAFGTLLRPDDYSVTMYRGLHDHISKGVPLRELFAEFLGRATGTCKGKGGPMHVTDPSSGLMVTTGVVGSGLPIANGLAWSTKLRGTDQVTIVNFGDGASNIGAFHEALNLAAVWKLPVVFVCQNNRYGEHTRYEWATSASQVSQRAIAYEMPGVTVDGNDPVATYWAADQAIARARSGGGPTLVEAMTYRFWGHIFGDNMRYMPAEERRVAMEADPALRYRQWLLDGSHLTEEQLVGIEGDARAAIDDAFEFAMESPPPGPEELYTDVYRGEVVPA